MSFRGKSCGIGELLEETWGEKDGRANSVWENFKNMLFRYEKCG